jgi:hypothetical protein
MKHLIKNQKQEHVGSTVFCFQKILDYLNEILDLSSQIKASIE